MAASTAAITYAIENDARLVLIDERDGRQVARRHDLDVTGAIGILLRGAREGTVDLRAELDALRDAGFWISDDRYAEVLRRFEEEFEWAVERTTNTELAARKALTGFIRRANSHSRTIDSRFELTRHDEA
jgi:hypothetical protein